MSLTTLFPDVITDQQLLRDLLDSVDTVVKQEFESPLQELLNLRSVSRLSEEQILLLTTRMLGYNIHEGNLEPIRDNLYGGVSMLGKFHEIDGTDTFYKFIEFITGRHIDIENLYTRDYADFYTSPHGPLLIDGGDWYTSTHINLYLEELPSDLRQQLLDYSQYIKQLLTVFYEYCPASLVVHTIGTMLYLHMRVFISGGAFVKKVDYHCLPGFGTLTDVLINGPSSIEGQRTIPYSVSLLWSTGITTTETAYNWNSDKLSVAQVSRTGTVHTGIVPVDTEFTLTAEYLGETAVMAITVLSSNDNELESMGIHGANGLDGGTSQQYTVTGHYSNGTSDDVYPVIRVTSPFAYMSGSTLTTSAVTRDTTIYLEAQLTSRSGVDIRAVFPVILRALDTGVTLTSVVIEGQTIALEQSLTPYQCKASYSDGQEETVVPKWVIATQVDVCAMLPDGRLSVGKIDNDFSLNLSCRYTYRGKTLTAKRIIKVRVLVKTVQNLFINGPDYVVEKESAQFYVNALWNDGSVSVVKPDWLTSKFVISQTGVFRAYGVRQQEPVLVSAVYFDPSGQQHTVNRTVTVAKKALVPVNISIRGPHSVKEGTIAQLEAFMHWSDGTITKAETIAWEIVDSPAFASIDIQGQFLFADPVLTTVTVRVTKQLGSTSYTTDKSIILVPKAVIINQLLISGPVSVNEDARGQYIATVQYDDGTEQTIQPVWTTEVVFPNRSSLSEDDVPVADISATGQLHARRVLVNTQVLVTARYFKEVASLLVTVTNAPEVSPDLISESRLDGPSVISTEGTGSFAQMIKFNSRNEELAVSSTWSINVPSTVAEITEDGYLMPRSNVDATITVTAVYMCGGNTITDTLIMQMQAIQETTYTLRIDGPASVESSTTVDYSAFLAADGQETNATAQVQWSTVSANGVGVDSSGHVSVPDIDIVVTFTLRATIQQGYNTLTATKIVTVSQQFPVYGVGPIGITDDTALLQHITTEMPGRESALTFTTDSAPGEYIYFAHPADLGVGQFIDASNNFEGAMDGASWPLDGSIASTVGPILIARDNGQGGTEDWYLHRSDFGGQGSLTFKVNYL